MTPLFVVSYRGRYLTPVLRWLVRGGVPEAYRVYVWDNGGADGPAAALGLRCCGLRDADGRAVNVGKAAATRHLVDIAREELPDADCYVCMDDDMIVDRAHLDALAAAARVPGVGMVGARFHPYQSPLPAGGAVRRLDGPGGPVDLWVYPDADRLERNTGRMAGGLFAVSAAAVGPLPWAPYLYPVLAEPGTGRPVVYWAEDAALDIALTRLGLVNGYLTDPTLTPVVHLPELNDEYLGWKITQRVNPRPAAVNPF